MVSGALERSNDVPVYGIESFGEVEGPCFCRLKPVSGGSGTFGKWFCLRESGAGSFRGRFGGAIRGGGKFVSLGEGFAVGIEGPEGFAGVGDGFAVFVVDGGEDSRCIIDDGAAHGADVVIEIDGGGIVAAEHGADHGSVGGVLLANVGEEVCAGNPIDFGAEVFVVDTFQNAIGDGPLFGIREFEKRQAVGTEEHSEQFVGALGIGNGRGEHGIRFESHTQSAPGSVAGLVDEAGVFVGDFGKLLVAGDEGFLGGIGGVEELGGGFGDALGGRIGFCAGESSAEGDAGFDGEKRRAGVDGGIGGIGEHGGRGYEGCGGRTSMRCRNCVRARARCTLHSWGSAPGLHRRPHRA